MKKAIFFFAFFLAVGIVSANAQCQGASASAGKACCSNKAAKAASADASIEKRLADDGSISYVRKESDAQGNVKFVSVQYDEASNAFVNAAPKSATAGAGASEGMVKKSCSASEAKACAGGAAKEGKACCAGKSAAACKKEQ